MLTTKWQLPVRTLPMNGLIETSMYPVSQDTKKKFVLHFYRFGRTFRLENDCSLEDYSVFYIGKESLTLTNHMMAYNECQV